MDLVSIRGKCPICGRGPIKPLAVKYSVFVTKPDQTERVGGLVAYQCTEEMHIFFVMARDVEEAQELDSA